MKVRSVEDPVAFLHAVEPLLLTDEARHNLLLGICGRLAAGPDDAPDFRLWVVKEEGEVVAAAGQTPPWNLVLARPATEAAGEALATALVEQGVELPGVTAAQPEVGRFAAAWKRATGRSTRVRMAQGIYRLESVQPVMEVSGGLRQAVPGDRDLLIEWVLAFQAEAVPGGSPLDAARMVDTRLANPAEGLTIWEDPDPVSMAGFGGATPNGVRIGPVYTPPDRRGRGYASALVAQTSQGLLNGGKRFCFLYTDLSNATSNAIYRRIGYEFVCESAEIQFETTLKPEPR
jgi:uncharacterized protein